MKKRILCIMLATLLSGCAMSSFVGRDVSDFHDVYDNSVNRTVLLNILRSMDNAPMHFSGLTNIHGSISGTVGVGLSLPFGPLEKSTARDTATPSYSVVANPTFDVGDLETQNFIAGMLNPIDPKVFKNFLDSGLDYRIAMLLFVSGLSRSDGKNQYPVILNSPESPRLVCYLTVAKGGLKPGDLPPPPYSIVLSPNDCRGGYGATESEFFAFLRVLNRLNPVYANIYSELKPIGPRLKLVGANFKDLTAMDTSKFALVGGSGKDGVQLATIEQKLTLCETQPDDDQLLHSAQDDVCKKHELPAPAIGTTNIGDKAQILSGLNLRSPVGMYKYVGELLSYQRQAHRCITLDFRGNWNDTCEGDVLFKVNSPALPSQIQATYKGTSYGVGGQNQCRTPDTCDHSTEVMNVLSLLLGLNKNAKDLPVTSSVQLVP